MPIIDKSDENIRDRVVRYIETRKKDNPGYKVIDVGGGANPWCDRLVDAYVDLNPLNTSKRQFNGDINTGAVWRGIGEREFDFSICTHTLEDIRNPGFVIENLIRVSKAGFIAMPNKHTEMSNIESVYWVGYCHHRWIFTISGGGVLRILAKLPLSGYFSSSNRTAHFLGGIRSGLLRSLLGRVRRAPIASGLSWVIPQKTRPGLELGFLWEGDFKYEYISGDYAGRNVWEAGRLYTEQLASGM